VLLLALPLLLVDRLLVLVLKEQLLVVGLLLGEVLKLVDKLLVMVLN
tara:strand:- start:648 stop:788 length:141 start_codon:yes stop_codon:yes gene_type:complete